MDYLFESDRHMVGFQHGDTYGKLYNKAECFYDAVTGFIMSGSASQSILNLYMQVLSVVTLQRKESNKFYMYTLQKLGDATVEHGNLKPFYGMVVYQRMTDNELAETKKAYDYDANIDFTDLLFSRAFEQLDTIFGITFRKKQKRNAGCDFDDSSSLQTIYKEKTLNFNITVGMRYTLGR